MAMIRKGAPGTNTLGSVQKCDAVTDYRPCSRRATITLIPNHVPGRNFVKTYWCDSHAERS
jgi:hypothetical protein